VCVCVCVCVCVRACVRARGFTDLLPHTDLLRACVCADLLTCFPPVHLPWHSICNMLLENPAYPRILATAVPAAPTSILLESGEKEPEVGLVEEGGGVMKICFFTSLASQSYGKLSGIRKVKLVKEACL